MLTVHDMGVDLLHPHRLEGARADVQSDISQPATARLETIQHGLVEMQTGRRRGNGAWMTRIDGLVPRQVLHAGRSFNIRRQWHFPQPVQYG